MTNLVDTLTIYQRLKSAHLEEEAAREIADVFRDVIESNLVSKTDLEAAKGDLVKMLEITKVDLVKMLEITKVDLVKMLEITKVDLVKMIEITKADLEKVIERTRADIIKWVAGMLVAQAAIVATLIKLL